MDRVDMSWDELNEYVAQQLAEFCRDNMHELNNHPMDYQDHYDYIIELYNEYIDNLADDNE